MSVYKRGKKSRHLSGVNYFFSSATIRIPVPLGQVKPLGATEKLVRGQI